VTGEARLGVAAAVEALDMAAPIGASDGEQLDWLGNPEAALPVEASRNPGTRAGVPNRRTARLRDYILARYRHPAEALAAIYSMSTVDLHAQLRALPGAGDVSAAEVLRIQVAAAGELLPYLEARRAPENEAGETVVPVLNIGVGVVSGAPAAPRGMSIDDIAKAQADQALSAADDSGSHDEGSHDAG